MAEIKIEQNPSEARLTELGVSSWGIWEKETSEFPWHYSDKETCYLLEGEVTVTPENGSPVTFGKGDLVTFPQGMSCSWKITKPVRKHFMFG